MLKPCPFCGSEARLIKRPTTKIVEDREEYEYHVRCQNLDCAVDLGIFVRKNVHNRGLYQEEAIAAWNLRS